MEDIQKAKQKPRGRIIAIIIVVLLLIAAVSAFIIYRGSISPVSAYAQFKKEMMEVKEMGDDYAENGMELQANYYYGIAGSSISAMRLAVDHILYLKGEEEYLENAEDNNSYQDWESIASISLASPYPYYFEGLTHHIQGNESEAEKAYKNAITNPIFPENGISFYYLNESSIDELSIIRNELHEAESEIYTFFIPEQYGFERHPMNYNDEYLRSKAKDILEQKPNNYSDALKYYYAALRANPFEAKNFACCSITAIFDEDIEAALYYVNEGLWVDENNEELIQIAAWLTQNRK